ncbi:MAG: hypothetical protein ACREJD_17585 [Phycisphaerales bacterium]
MFRCRIRTSWQRVLVAAASVVMMSGCGAPSARLSFPTSAAIVSPSGREYDVDGDGKPDFALQAGAEGRLDTLAYDDDQDGKFDRKYSLADYHNEDVPHLIILLDSIPYSAVADRYREAGWTWFCPPQKVIPAFPSLTEIIITRMVGAPPVSGMINDYYDVALQKTNDRIRERVGGEPDPWERRLHHRLTLTQTGLAFLEPRSWFHAELALAKSAFDHSPDRVTIVYFASAACMLSKYGADGLREVLDGVEQLCLEILWERRGAVKISALADHGHNLIAEKRIDLPAMLKQAGFNPQARLRADRDVVVELDGLVNYAGIHTRHAAEVARVLTSHAEIQLAMYREGDRVIVRDAHGAAAIEFRHGTLRYVVLDHDVLDFQPVIVKLTAAGKADADGFIESRDWFDATVDHQWPDAPSRIWNAFSIVSRNTPSVMVTTMPGSMVGLSSMEWFIKMASTHGGLDQRDSATFMLTMTGRGQHPMRSEEVLKTIEPSYDPRVLRP